MRFINPKTDFAFKKIFASETSKLILISFLNALIYQGNPTIQSLQILNPYQAGLVSGLKESYLDVKAVLDSGKIVIIEMQILNVAGFEKRIVYNAAKAYVEQLDIGAGYTQLNPVIGLTIMDFTLFPNPEKYISRFFFKEEEELYSYPRQELELVFVELPKFNKPLHQLYTLTEKWIFFLKNTPSLEMIPEPLEIVPEIQQALTLANRANLTRDELDEIEKREFFLEDQRKLRQEGLEMGLQRERDLVMRLLVRKVGNIDEPLREKIQQFSFEEIERLGEALLEFEGIEDLRKWLKSP